MELWHHGIKGQKWGVRRYQNPDGSLTAAGRKRYLSDDYNLQDVIKNYGEYNRQTGKYKNKNYLNKRFLKRIVYGGKDFNIDSDQKLYRVTKTKNEKFKDRMYVSANEYGYANDYFVDDVNKTYSVTYKTPKQLKVAGLKTVSKYLKEIGDLDTNIETRDFVFTNKELGNKVMEELRKNGYNAMADPADMDWDWSNIPIIMIENSLKKVGTQKISDLY